MYYTVYMNRTQQLICVGLLIFPSISWGWGRPATATTTIEARVTTWTENPCDYGNRFTEACEYAKRHILFPEAARPGDEPVDWTNTIPNQTTVTNYE